MPFSPPRKVVCSAERRAQHTVWRGAVSGWTASQNSGNRCLPEICGQEPVLRLILKERGVSSCAEGDTILEMLWRLQMPSIIGLGKVSGEKLYTSALPSPFLAQKVFFRDPPPRRNFMRPSLLLHAPQPWKGILGVGRWGCLKFGPPSFPQT